MKTTFYDNLGDEKLSINFNSTDTNWQSFIPTINATLSNPTKGSTRIEKCFWRREGSDLLISFYYSQTSAGTAGSGTYLFQLPASLIIDTSIITTGSDTTPTTHATVVGHGKDSDPSNTYISEIIAFNSTSLAIYHVVDTTSGNGNAFVQSGASPLSNSSCSYTFTARVPILGWSINDAILAEGLPATKSDISAEIANGKFISPDKARFAPGVAKAWVNFDSTGTIKSSYNISSIIHNATGDYTINFIQPFNDTNYCISGTSSFFNGSAPCFVALNNQTPKSTTLIRVLTYRTDTNTTFDAEETSLVFFGEQ